MIFEFRCAGPVGAAVFAAGHGQTELQVNRGPVISARTALPARRLPQDHFGKSDEMRGDTCQSTKAALVAVRVFPSWGARTIMRSAAYLYCTAYATADFGKSHRL